MAEFNTFREIKKTRKERHCVYCNRTIEIGEKCYNYVGICEGYFQNWYLCECCEHFYNLANINWEDGIGEISDDLYEFVYKLKCPRCQQSNLNDWDYDTKLGLINCDCICQHRWSVTFEQLIRIDAGEFIESEVEANEKT